SWAWLWVRSLAWTNALRTKLRVKSALVRATGAAWVMARVGPRVYPAMARTAASSQASGVGVGATAAGGQPPACSAAAVGGRMAPAGPEPVSSRAPGRDRNASTVRGEPKSTQRGGRAHTSPHPSGVGGWADER